MKLMTGVLLVAGTGVIAFAAGWFGAGLSVDTGLENQVVLYSVQLTPHASSGKLSIESPAGKCEKGNHAGCLVFEEDKIGVIRLFLPGSEKTVKTCQDASNVITRIELTTTGEGGDQNAENGVFAGNLPIWIKVNAFKKVSRVSGIVYDTTLDQAVTRVTLINLNANDMNNGVKNFWYRVTVTSCQNPADSWLTDSRGDNMGTRY